MVRAMKKRHVLTSIEGSIRRRACLDYLSLPPEIRTHHSLRPNLRVRYWQKESASDPNHRFRRGRWAIDRIHNLLFHGMQAFACSMDSEPRPLRKTACRVAWNWHREPDYRCLHLQRSHRLGRGSTTQLAQQDHSGYSAFYGCHVSSSASPATIRGSQEATTV